MNTKLKFGTFLLCSMAALATSGTALATMTTMVPGSACRLANPSSSGIEVNGYLQATHLVSSGDNVAYCPIQQENNSSDWGHYKAFNLIANTGLTGVGSCLLYATTWTSNYDSYATYYPSASGCSSAGCTVGWNSLDLIGYGATIMCPMAAWSMIDMVRADHY